MGFELVTTDQFSGSPYVTTEWLPSLTDLSEDTSNTWHKWNSNCENAENVACCLSENIGVWRAETGRQLGEERSVKL